MLLDSFKLPNSWSTIQVDDAVKTISTNGKKIPQKEYLNQGLLPVIDQGQDFIGGYTNDLSLKVECSLPIIIFGDHTRVIKYINQNFAAGADGVKVLESKGFFNVKLLNYFIQYMTSKLPNHGYARHYQHLSKESLPLPPINEQHRIAAKIEELFSELDQGIANIKTAQAQLKVYRQTLLKYAFEGKLTAEWRAQNADKLESVSELQQRVQQVRTKNYQQQLAKWEAHRKQGSKPKAPKPIVLLSSEELANLPEFPKGWGWLKFGELCEKIFDGTHFSPKSSPEGKYKYITAKNIKEGYLDLTHITYLDEVAHREIYSRCDVKPGDVLYIKDGVTTGIAAVNRLDEEFSLLSSVGVFRFPKGIVSPDYAAYFLNSSVTRHRMLKEVAGVAITRLTLVKLNRAYFVLPPIEEQRLIVGQLELKLFEIDKLDQTIITSLQQAEALRQAILKKAFSGELVPQNTADEPASKLLERIRAEKAAQAPLSKAKVSKSKPLKDNVIIFPVKVPHIEVTELHAGLMALAYRQHERHRRAWYFGHVKAEKISHMIESCIGIDLERMPIQDAAGPNDFKRLLAVEAFARQQHWFDVKKQQNGRHLLTKLSGFDALIRRTEAALGNKLESVNALIKLFVSFDTKSSEIVATLFAAWNNLLLLGHKPNDVEIVLEARDNWHEDKLNISKERFDRCLIWMRKHGLVPVGRGCYVPKQNQRNVPKRFKAELENDFMQASNANKGSIK